MGSASRRPGRVGGPERARRRRRERLPGWRPRPVALGLRAAGGAVGGPGQGHPARRVGRRPVARHARPRRARGRRRGRHVRLRAAGRMRVVPDAARAAADAVARPCAGRPARRRADRLREGERGRVGPARRRRSDCPVPWECAARRGAAGLQWSPDGRWLFFDGQSGPADEAVDREFVVRPNGSGLHELASRFGYLGAWSPAGDRLLFSCKGNPWCDPAERSRGRPCSRRGGGRGGQARHPRRGRGRLQRRPQRPGEVRGSGDLADASRGTPSTAAGVGGRREAGRWPGHRTAGPCCSSTDRKHRGDQPQFVERTGRGSVQWTGC